MNFEQGLDHVLGQAFQAAGYSLGSSVLEQQRGLFRYQKPLPEGLFSFVEIQNLPHSDFSRFRVLLIRSDQNHPRLVSENKIEILLGVLLWDDFGVKILGSPEYWWVYRNPPQLGQALFQAGQLLFAYGIPWLEQTL